jgi:formylglycine-generating enzyme required for sulfatase activity
MKSKVLMAVCFLCLLCNSICANNILTGNIKLTSQNTGNHTTKVQFDISWENSWRTNSGPANWDAAWVFVKYRVGNGQWSHAYLNNGGFNAPAGSTINIGLLNPGSSFQSTTNPGMGAFIYRSANGNGTFALQNVQLQWNYGANSVADNALVDIQVYAIEQVYVPAGSFFAGTGAGSQPGAEYGSFYTYPTESNPYQVTGEGAINVGTSAGNLYYDPTINDPFVGDKLGPIPAAYPKGYAAFYCMKYELSQQGYAEFLNSLPYGISRAHYNYALSIDVNRFHIDTALGSSTFRARSPYIACNFLSWFDLSAYLAWAGLRPMTELEYEKACRGTLTPVFHENAWGTPSSATQYYTIGHPNDSTEYIAAQLSTFSGIGNVSCYNTVGFVSSPTQGPLRVGIFAASAMGLPSADRATAGATYYGIMEMSGNVWERAVSVGSPQGRVFAGSHGNGALSATGAAANTDWPGGTTALGVGQRGGSFFTPNTEDSLSISGRRFANYLAPVRSPVYGGRGVRTAP